MFQFWDTKKENIRTWAVAHAEGSHARFWLSVLSFSEASFFPIPPDILLIAILLANKARRWAYWAAITTLFSVLGGIFGYLIGFAFFGLFGERLIAFYHFQDQFFSLKELFDRNAFLAIFAAAFTPIPYKVFTIAAGLFRLDPLAFFVASILGRGIRFFLIAYLLKYFGETLSRVLYKYFNLISFLVLILLVFLIYSFF